VLKIIFTFILSISILGCSTHFESTNQINDSAFLQLEGDFFNTQLTLDEGAAVELTEGSIKTFSLNGRKVVRFPITTGKHTLTITRSGNVIVNRIIYVSNSNTFEVVIP
jgi:hypothetical protein|tara:strand:- start:54 stop:380 length:327 start_codon:yes stop_codon:yes gene_type:complete